MPGQLVIAVDDARLRARLRRALSSSELHVESVENVDALWASIARRSSDLVLLSRTLIGDPATDAIAGLRALPEAPEVVVLDAEQDPEDRARLLAAGAFAVLDAQLSSHAVRDVVGALLARRAQAASGTLVTRRALPDPRLDDFITSSPAMKAFMGLVHRVVHSDTSLLVLGETGVGKEHLARAIHAESPRASGPFIAVNCGAIAETLLESELFGHEEGAFTGATRARRGSFELAHKGVVFLDEIGELPPHLQVKLLHVLQRREIQRVGGEAALPIDVRIMAATNRDIADEVTARRFRPDLYYRLSVVTLAIPALRERREDIAVLVDSYLDYFRGHIRRDVRGVSGAALAALEAYDWPGNVRELVNVIERAMLLAASDMIEREDLPESMHGTRGGSSGTSILDVVTAPTPAARTFATKTLREARALVLDEFERAYITALLRETGGRVGETARRAGIEPRSLFEKMKRHGLSKETFRPPSSATSP